MTTDRRVLLLVEDPFLRRAAEASLRQRGFAVTGVSDLGDALEQMSALRHDVIVLDLREPPGGGLELLRALKSSDAARDVPVVVLSNSSRQADEIDAMSAGATVFLPKAEVSLKDVGERVEQVLSGDA